MNKKIKKIIYKKNKSKIVCLTAYSKKMASIIDQDCDIVLVGDSVANVIYGMPNTHKIELKTIINHAKAVRQGIKNSLMIIDMPKGTYRNEKQAKANAKKILKQTRCDAIKIESNNKNFQIIKNLVKNRIPVMGHIGYTPQFKKKFKIYGSNFREKRKLINEAIKIEKAGAFSIVLECVKKDLAKEISEILKIPTIGIGSSVHCDGQILVTEDILGMSGFYPKFVKKYVNLNRIISKTVRKYSIDVKRKKFPTKKNAF
jgi:3-methyl-2-oxobutanoate hydroxymethyltransferase|tara:strand:- start:392 stop:1165 length:774 start_codon:yes stop_codon:yes gene_type:complete